MKERAREFDRAGVRAVRPCQLAAKAKRLMSVREALEWAFAVERASVDFDDFAGPGGVDTIWRLMQRGRLGCEIDGGGSTPRHDDAEVIASIVAQLPVSVGGKAMAVQLATLARAGMVPDWMPGAAPRCVPQDTRLTKHGLFAKTEVVGSEETQYRGRKVKHDVVVCPVTYRPSMAQISAARRAYLDWWGALLDLQYRLAVAGLRTIRISREMPEMTPWHKAVDSQNVNL